MEQSPISRFLDHHYRHFNAAAMMDAAQGYKKFVEDGGKMLVTLAGAMSTGELGLSLAEMIRQDKVHFISCTGANMEEDVYNLVAHNHYRRLPKYRCLTPDQENELYKECLNRVTDTCIPEETAIRVLDSRIIPRWKEDGEKGDRRFPHEYFYEILLSGKLEPFYQIDPKNSWLLAAAQKNIPMVVPGWEDSTLGNMYAAQCYTGNVKPATTIKGGIEYMMSLIEWYREESKKFDIGFFQIGGGIAGDFPICSVPLIEKDLQEEVKKWRYFCQISEAITSFGGYSGAVPNEKITWGKLEVDTPSFVVESDATIVAPLIFAYVLGW